MFFSYELILVMATLKTATNQELVSQSVTRPGNDQAQVRQEYDIAPMHYE